MARIANAATEPEEHEEIEITSEMIEAGRRELLRFDHDFEDERDAAKRIYLSMERLLPRLMRK
jgi:hypothetical protein